jgi:Uma2 family endonuclease
MIASPAQTQTGMALDDYIRECDRSPFELIDGERIEKMPTVFGPSELMNLLYNLLFMYTSQHKMGRVYSETTFILPGSHSANWVKGSFVPDIMFFAGTRIDDYKAANPDYAARPLELIPDLVVEVVSPTDLYSDISRKIDACLSIGVRLIWLLDPQRGAAVVYASGQPPLPLASDGVLSGGEVVAGFEVALSALFAG